MGPLAPKGEEVLHPRPRALSRIQAHPRIARVKAPLPVERVMKCAAGKTLKKVNEGDGADVNELYLSKINFPI